jgi:hypothetical protein
MFLIVWNTQLESNVHLEWKKKISERKISVCATKYLTSICIYQEL